MNDGRLHKVDREERPDIDAIYMEAVQAISGHGGWPMTVFMTGRQPFFAARTTRRSSSSTCSRRSPTHGGEARRAARAGGQITQSLNRMATMTTPEGQTLPGTDVLNSARSRSGRSSTRVGRVREAPKFRRR
jgi:hypothetical protein